MWLAGRVVREPDLRSTSRGFEYGLPLEGTQGKLFTHVFKFSLFSAVDDADPEIIPLHFGVNRNRDNVRAGLMHVIRLLQFHPYSTLLFHLILNFSVHRCGVNNKIYCWLMDARHISCALYYLIIFLWFRKLFLKKKCKGHVDSEF